MTSKSGDGGPESRPEQLKLTDPTEQEWTIDDETRERGLQRASEIWEATHIDDTSIEARRRFNLARKALQDSQEEPQV